MKNCSNIKVPTRFNKIEVKRSITRSYHLKKKTMSQKASLKLLLMAWPYTFSLDGWGQLQMIPKNFLNNFFFLFCMIGTRNRTFPTE